MLDILDCFSIVGSYLLFPKMSNYAQFAMPAGDCICRGSMRPLSVEVFSRKRLLVTPKFEELDKANDPGFCEYRYRFTQHIKTIVAKTVGAIVPAECLSSAWA